MTKLQFQKYVEPCFIVLALVALGLTVSEADRLENTIGGVQLFWFAFTAGGLPGLAAGVLFCYYRHELLSGMLGPVQRSALLTANAALILGFLSVAGASHVNRTHAREARQSTVTVTDKFQGKGQAMTPRLVIQLDSGVEEHIWVDRSFWDRIVPGDEVHLCLRPGALGYDVVEGWSAGSGAGRSSSICG